jgi:hypothetical protein
MRWCCDFSKSMNSICETWDVWQITALPHHLGPHVSGIPPLPFDLQERWLLPSNTPFKPMCFFCANFSILSCFCHVMFCHVLSCFFLYMWRYCQRQSLYFYFPPIDLVMIAVKFCIRLSLKCNCNVTVMLRLHWNALPYTWNTALYLCALRS